MHPIRSTCELFNVWSRLYIMLGIIYKSQLTWRHQTDYYWGEYLLCPGLKWDPKCGSVINSPEEAERAFAVSGFENSKRMSTQCVSWNVACSRMAELNPISQEQPGSEEEEKREHGSSGMHETYDWGWAFFYCQHFCPHVMLFSFAQRTLHPRWTHGCLR